MSKNVIKLPGEFMFKYGNSKITVGNLTFDVGFLKDLISDEFYYDLKKIYKDGDHKIKVVYNVCDEDFDCGVYPVSTFTRALEEYMLDLLD